VAKVSHVQRPNVQTLLVHRLKSNCSVLVEKVLLRANSSYDKHQCREKLISQKPAVLLTTASNNDCLSSIGCFASVREYVSGTPTLPASSRLLDICCFCSSASLRPTSRSDTVSLAADAACFADFEGCFFGLAAFLPFAGALLLALPCFPTCSHPPSNT